MADEKKKTGAKKKSAKKRGKRGGQRHILRTVLIVLGVLLALFILGCVFLGNPQPEEEEEALPMAYTELILQYAEEQDIDPAYVAAVVFAESSCRPDAVSSVNAQGLMQIMPETGAWIAGKFDEEYTEGCLFDPETNIRYGCWYLGYLVRRFSGDLTLSTAAYHSGQGTVDKWLQNPEYSANGVKLDVIPGAEAEKYVNRVLNYYETYEKQFAALSEDS